MDEEPRKQTVLIETYGEEENSLAEEMTMARLQPGSLAYTPIVNDSGELHMRFIVYGMNDWAMGVPGNIEMVDDEEDESFMVSGKLRDVMAFCVHFVSHNEAQGEGSFYFMAMLTLVKFVPLTPSRLDDQAGFKCVSDTSVPFPL